MVFLDFAKAFDKVPISKLLSEMEMVDICFRITRWVKDFPSGRTYQVRVKDEFSPSYLACNGGAQGGALSPLLSIYLHVIELVISAVDNEAYLTQIRNLRGIRLIEPHGQNVPFKIGCCCSRANEVSSCSTQRHLRALLSACFQKSRRLCRAEVSLTLYGKPLH